MRGEKKVKEQEDCFRFDCSGGSGLPEVTGQIDAVFNIETDTLGQQQGLLFLVSLPRSQGYPAPAVDHPVPGQGGLSGGGVQDPDHPPDRPGVTRHHGHLAVGHHPAGRHGLDDLLHPQGK